MRNDHDHWLGILSHNRGFEHPEDWVDFAREHDFEMVDAFPVLCCPDCGEAGCEVVGRYIYYSSLISLRYCDNCSLIYADTHIDPVVIKKHFEQAYKDEEYFKTRRKPIFDFIADLVEKLCPVSGTAIDVGGAKGHLLAQIRQRRPDIDLTLSDISEISCRHAMSKHGFKSICAPIPELCRLDRRFDVVTLIDSMYYEPDIHGVWRVIDHLVKDTGVLILRVPNTFRLIRISRRLKSDFNGSISPESVSRVRFFNREQVYVYSKKYLTGKLKKHGFKRVTYLPSPLLSREQPTSLLTRTLFEVSRVVSASTLGGAIITPALIVVAQRGN